MAKYNQKKQSPKSAGDVVQVETGVVTRAKARAMLKSGSAQAGNYLQLRSRCVERIPIAARKMKQRANRRKLGMDKNALGFKVKMELGETDVAGDGSTGQGMDRYSRETTPEHLIRDPNIIRSPGPWTRPGRKPRIAMYRITHDFHPKVEVPDDFLESVFGVSEAKQIEEFIEKYNFDPEKEEPLPGRFVWEKVDPKEGPKVDPKVDPKEGPKVDPKPKA